MNTYIRPIVRDDCDTFCSLATASAESHAPHVYPPKDAAEFFRYLDAAGPRFLQFAICCSQTDRFVGVCNVSEIVRGCFDSAYLGYYTWAPYMRKGFMASGMRHVIEHCFTELGLHRLEANIQPDNRVSIALVQRLGFKREGYSPAYLRIDGEWRDHERWTLINDCWQPDDQPDSRP